MRPRALLPLLRVPGEKRFSQPGGPGATSVSSGLTRVLGKQLPVGHTDPACPAPPLPAPLSLRLLAAGPLLPLRHLMAEGQGHGSQHEVALGGPERVSALGLAGVLSWLSPTTLRTLPG